MAQMGANKMLQQSETVDVGCLWGLMQLFNFRHPPKLLSHKDHGPKDQAGRSNAITSRNYEDPESNTPGSQVVAMEEKQSIRKLIEEEMGDIHPEKPCGTAMPDLTPLIHKEECSVGCIGLRFGVPKVSFKIDLYLPESVIEMYKNQKEHKQYSSMGHMEPVTSNVDLTENVNLDSPKISPDENSTKLEKALDDIAKLVISQKILDSEKHLPTCKSSSADEFVNAVSELRSNKELLEKLLQDPQSHMKEKLEGLFNSLGSRDSTRSESSTQSEVLEEEGGKHDEADRSHTEQKKNRYWLMDEKLITKKQLNTNGFSQTSNRIVILKPNPARSQNHLMSDETAPLKEECGGRSSQQFSIKEIRKRLKFALGKEHHSITIDGHPLSREQVPAEFLEKVLLASPSSNPEKGYELPSTDDEEWIEDFQNGPSLTDYSQNLLKSESSTTSISDYMVGVTASRGYPRKEEGNAFFSKNMGLPSFQGIEKEVDSEEIDTLNRERSTCTASGVVHAPSENSKIKDNNATVHVVISCTEAREESIGFVEGVEKMNSCALEKGDLEDTTRGEVSQEYVDRPASSSLECFDELLATSKAVYQSVPGHPDNLVTQSDELGPEKQDLPCAISVVDASISVDNTIPESQPPENYGVYSVLHSIKHGLQLVSMDNQWSAISILQNKDDLFAFVSVVLNSSGLFAEKGYSERWITDPIVDPTLFTELVKSHKHGKDIKLVFDCICEVLTDIQNKHFGTCDLLVHQNFRPALHGTGFIRRVSKIVEQHLNYKYQVTLDQMIKRDFDTKLWMDLQTERESFAISACETILDELLEEFAFELWF